MYILETIVLAFLGILIVVTVHELGHFVAFIYFGVPVETFGIGVGPVLYSFTWRETTFKLHAFLLFAYVKPLINMNVIKGTHEVVWKSYHLKFPEIPLEDPFDRYLKPWQQLVVFFAGPFANIVLGAILFAILKIGSMNFFAALIIYLVKFSGIVIFLPVLLIYMLLMSPGGMTLLGPVGLGMMFAPIVSSNSLMAGVHSFTQICALLSVSIAAANMFPLFGVTDGGKIWLLGIRMFMGKNFVRDYFLVQISFLLLSQLILAAILLDIFRLF